MLGKGCNSLVAVTDNQPISFKCTKKTSRLNFASCRWRWFKQKSVGLVLFWGFTAFILGNYALRRFIFSDGVVSGKVKLSLTVLGMAVFTLGAWFIADVYVGRYRVIKTCVLIMFTGTVLYSLSLSLKSIIGVAYTVVDQVIVLVICFGLAGFEANIVQFSMDQLQDSPTGDISSYISLYMWTFFFSESCGAFVSSCICTEYDAISSLVYPILLGLVLSSDFLFSHWLVKEPVTHNPLKLIFQVLRYAAKNKYPSDRSAFTYWDNINSSRVDLAMRKYGGPFSTEQVDDVKKFFQILCILVIICFLMGMLLIDSSVYHISIPFNFRGIESNSTCSSKVQWYRAQCIKHFLIDIGYIVAVFFIPIWEIFLFPVFWKCLMRWKILVRNALAMAVLFMYIVSLITIQGIGGLKWRRLNPNATHTCPISSGANASQPNFFEISYAWLAVPSILINLGVSMTMIAGLQFVFAQSPYSMKGLIVNATYLMFGMAVLTVYGFQMLFHLPFFDPLGDLGCVFWFLLACGVVTLVLISLFLLACCRYQNRQRDDTGTLSSASSGTRSY